MSIKIYPYNSGSGSARLLAEAMECQRIRTRFSLYTPKEGDVVINWGKGKDWAPARTINYPDNVSVAVNKLRFFQAMELDGHTRIPDFTTNHRQAEIWCADGHVVFSRQELSAFGGRGIIVCKTPYDVVPAPLYVKYIPKDSEWRVHVIDRKVTTVQRKVLPDNVERHANIMLIRNHQNGFIFQRNNIQAPEDVLKQAVKAVTALRLDFGAADVIWNQRLGQAFVLEVNTAPGIEGTTVKEYAGALQALANKR